MSFHLGKPLLIMLIAAVISGSVIAFRPADRSEGLLLWTFADSHARTFRGHRSTTQPTLVDQYRDLTDTPVTVKLIGNAALNLRLNAIFDRSTVDGEVPDLVEIEIGSVGRYFRGRTADIGFLPLNDRLARDGLIDQLLPARLAPWTKDGVIFGLPHDVHPVTITYRRDLFAEAGVDIASAKTWSDFHQKCLAYQAYWKSHGRPLRRAMELQRSSTEALESMLLQRHINLLDDTSTPRFSDPRTIATIVFYARLVAGPNAIGADSTPGGTGYINDLLEGHLGAMLTPDWRADYFRPLAPGLSGNLAMMPLPRFDPTDAPTATRGGTMIAIPRQARDPEKSWQLAKFLYYSPQGLEARRQYTNILPPLLDAWNDPMWHRADPFFGGQMIGELLIAQSRRLPKRYVTPFTTMGNQALSMVLGRAVNAIEAGRDATLESEVTAWCAEADRELRRRIEFGRFDE